MACTSSPEPCKQKSHLPYERRPNLELELFVFQGTPVAQPLLSYNPEFLHQFLTGSLTSAGKGGRKKRSTETGNASGFFFLIAKPCNSPKRLSFPIITLPVHHRTLDSKVQSGFHQRVKEWQSALFQREPYAKWFSASVGRARCACLWFCFVFQNLYVHELLHLKLRISTSLKNNSVKLSIGGKNCPK